MLSRVMRLLAVASSVGPVPAAARRAGTIEVGAFARYVDFDNTLPMGDDMDIGGRVGVYLEPALTLEGDLARSSQSSVTYTPLHVRAVYNGSVSSRIEALVGGGDVRHWYRAPYNAADQGLTMLLGMRFHVPDQLWLRLGAGLHFMVHTPDNH